MTSVETIEVTQSDREAAAPFMSCTEDWYLGDRRYSDLLIEAFARHRLSTRPNSDADALLRQIADFVWDDGDEGGAALSMRLLARHYLSENNNAQ